MKARRQRKQVEATGGVEETEAKFIPGESYGVEKERKKVRERAKRLHYPFADVYRGKLATRGLAVTKFAD